uniref:Corticotropin releasing hormone receptor 2 n=2 Tax=Eptatretus burgeri TaxID=7764 RepID=A0A8C4QX69_EPTBU
MGLRPSLSTAMVLTHLLTGGEGDYDYRAEEVMLNFGVQEPSDCVNRSALNVTRVHCHSTQDAIGTCWPQSPTNTLAILPCPAFLTDVKYHHGLVSRECLSNATWASWANYTDCKPNLEIMEEVEKEFHYKVALIINYLGHCLSLLALTTAFVLFALLRSIRCLRNIIHWNLVGTFILRNTAWFLLNFIDQHVHKANKPWCRMIVTFYNYFLLTNFFWMFAEGCYLHTVVVMTYSSNKLRKWLFFCLGWGIPCPIIVAWALCKLYYDNDACWLKRVTSKPIDYIYQCSIILVLVINFTFFFNIVRILMTKLRASTTSETIQYRKAVKATMVLLPLLGINHLLFFINPGEDLTSQVVFVYFNSILQSLQGFFVSVFYCFLNGEVRSAVRKRWHLWQDEHRLRARLTRATSMPTSPSHLSFHSLKPIGSM